MRIIGTLIVAAVPMVGILGLLWLSERLRARRETARRLQITVTDAVHAALGAAAAPVVTRRRDGGWRVAMRVEAGRTELTAALVRVTEDVMGRVTRESRRPFEIVLLTTGGVSAAGRGRVPAGHHTKITAPLSAVAR
jgi:hypothetical protein